MRTPKESLAEFKRDKGNLNAELPDVMAHLDGLFQVSLAGGALTMKEKEFIVLGIALATHCEPCILVHLEKALGAGATKAEILEACGVAVAMGGGATMACVPLVLKYLDACDGLFPSNPQGSQTV
jgi:AhpD family alkylhydroperoxidase